MYELMFSLSSSLLTVQCKGRVGIEFETATVLECEKQSLTIFEIKTLCNTFRNVHVIVNTMMPQHSCSFKAETL